MDFLSKINKISNIIFETLNLDIYVGNLDNKTLIEQYHTPYPDSFFGSWSSYTEWAWRFLKTDRPFSCIFHEVTDFGLMYLDAHILDPEGQVVYICIGPALTKPYSDAYINQLMHQEGCPPQKRTSIANFYKSKPFFNSRIRDAFWISCQLLEHAAQIEQFTIDAPTVYRPIFQQEPSKWDDTETEITPEEIALNYETEKKVRALIGVGDRKGAKELACAGSSNDFTYRHPDTPLRAIKNTWLSWNAVCRVAAHDGGANVTDIHAVHEEFSVLIENCTNTADFMGIGDDLIDRYCDLVIDARTQNYSAPVKKAVTYLHNHYSEQVTLPQLAQQTHYSEGHLSRRIREETGLPFNAYLNSLRIEHACRLLESGDYTISDAALQVGFSSYSKFGIEFKKYVGMPATAYRKQKQHLPKA